MDQQVNLSGLLSIAVSLVRFCPFCQEDVCKIMSNLKRTGPLIVKGLKFYSLGHTDHRSDYCIGDPGDCLVALKKKLGEMLKEQNMRLSLLLNVTLPFTKCDAVLNVYHSSRASCFVLELGQDVVLEPSGSSYNQIRMAFMKELACSIFRDIQPKVGLVSTSDHILSTSLDDIFDNPPGNWVYWGEDIMQEVPLDVVEDAKSRAQEFNKLPQGGIFWIWSDFGMHVNKSLKSHMSSLAESSASVFKRRCFKR